MVVACLDQYKHRDQGTELRLLPSFSSHCISRRPSLARSGLIAYPITVLYRHQRRGEKGNEPFLASRLGNDLRLRDGKGPPSLDDAGASENAVAGRWSQQVDFELGGEHTDARRQQAERGISSGRVGNGCKRAGMDEAMLL
jgi:hypothetical protein